MPKLFVYGSLLEEPVIKQHIGRVPISLDGAIEGFRKDIIYIDGEEWFIAVRDEGSSIDGKFLTVEKSELSLLDEWEGPDYQRIEIAEDIFIYAQPDRTVR